MRDEFLIQRQGKQYVLFAGLLDEAHNRGLRGIDTELVQVPTAENGNVAVVKAVVNMEDSRTFSGIGDASPDNVGRNIVPHIIRMAETRAKARALRDAVNVGVASLEELSDSDEGSSTQNPRQARTEAQSASEGQPEAQRERTPGGATRKQAEYLVKLLVDAGHEEEKVRPFVEQMGAAECSEKIKEYKPKEVSG